MMQQQREEVVILFSIVVILLSLQVMAELEIWKNLLLLVEGSCLASLESNDLFPFLPITPNIIRAMTTTCTTGRLVYLSFLDNFPANTTKRPEAKK